MKTNKSKTFWIAMIIILSGLLPACSDKYDANDSGISEKVDTPAEEAVDKSKGIIEESKEAAALTAEKVKEFTFKNKEEAVETINSGLSAMDKQVDEFKKWSHTKWDTYTSDSKSKYEKAIDAIDDQREEVNSWLEKMEASTTEEWATMKEGFLEAYSRLTHEWEELKSELNISES